MRLRSATAGLILSTALLPASGLFGCARSCAPPVSPSSDGVVIDGELGEWSDDTALRADGTDLQIRMSLPEVTNLQSAPDSVVVLLDIDGDPSTGAGLADVRGDTTGADIALVFSPRGPRGGRGEGVTGLVLPAQDPGEAPQPLPHEALDLVFAPTYAARDFELRVSRRVRGRPGLSAALADGTVSARLIGVGGDGSLRWSKSLGSVDLPPLAPVPERFRATIPGRPDDAVRVVSWNVRFATPQRRPAPFARVLHALAPDVVLVQEWEKATASELRAWFETHLGGVWHAVDSAGWGVAVVARGPLERLGPARIERPEDAPADRFRPDQALRLAAAIVQTRLGPLAAASMHLKCCGPAGGPQDRARIAEARAIRATLRRALAALGGGGPVVRVIGGDLNLVGSRTPLDVLRRGLAAGGGDLAIARTDVLGDRALYTWRGAGSRYSPGRLDFLLYGGAEEVAAFVVDPSRLPDGVLASSGLRRDDAAASDHLALVLDVRPPPASSATRPE